MANSTALAMIHTLTRSSATLAKSILSRTFYLPANIGSNMASHYCGTATNNIIVPCLIILLVSPCYWLDYVSVASTAIIVTHVVVPTAGAHCPPSNVAVAANVSETLARSVVPTSTHVVTHQLLTNVNHVGPPWLCSYSHSLQCSHEFNA